MAIIVSNFKENKAIFNPNSVFSASGNLQIRKCLFSSNYPLGKWNSIRGTNGKGGAIQAEGGNLVIDLCYFFNNSKNIGGSLAFYFTSDSKFMWKVLISRCIFENNTAVLGGGIFMQSTKSVDIFISNSFFLRNWAAQGYLLF